MTREATGGNFGRIAQQHARNTGELKIGEVTGHNGTASSACDAWGGPPAGGRLKVTAEPIYYALDHSYNLSAAVGVFLHVCRMCIACCSARMDAHLGSLCRTSTSEDTDEKKASLERRRGDRRACVLRACLGASSEPIRRKRDGNARSESRRGWSDAVQYRCTHLCDGGPIASIELGDAADAPPCAPCRSHGPPQKNGALDREFGCSAQPARAARIQTGSSMPPSAPMPNPSAGNTMGMPGPNAGGPGPTPYSSGFPHESEHGTVQR